MDAFQELDELIPPDADAEAWRARRRLQGAIRSEVRSRRRLGFSGRATAIGLVIFSVWSIAPSAPTDDQLPLLGLAAATARLGVDVVEPGALWYTKAEVLERVDIANGVDEFTVLKRSVQEEWFAPDADRGLQRTTVADFSFLSDEDQARFAEVSGDFGLETGLVSVDELDLQSRWTDPMWSGGPAAIERRLRVIVGASGDTRLDRVRMLDAAAELMWQNGSDPVRQSLLLFTVSDFPGIEVSRSDGVVTVSYRYVLDAVAREMLLDFDAATGRLISESVSTLPYGEHPAVLLSHTEYQWAMPGDESYLPPHPGEIRPAPTSDTTGTDAENRSGASGKEQP